MRLNTHRVTAHEKFGRDFLVRMLIISFQVYIIGGNIARFSSMQHYVGSKSISTLSVMWMFFLSRTKPVNSVVSRTLSVFQMFSWRLGCNQAIYFYGFHCHSLQQTSFMIFTWLLSNSDNRPKKHSTNGGHESVQEEYIISHDATKVTPLFITPYAIQ